MRLSTVVLTSLVPRGTEQAVKSKISHGARARIASARLIAHAPHARDSADACRKRTVREKQGTLARMHAVARALIADMRATLVTCADETRAPAMQAYMKSVMPYHGVSAVPMR